MINSKFEIRNSKLQSGITLFEILLVITIFVGVIMLANQALFSTLRGGSKSQVSVRVKQAAEYAFEVMERDLRQASGIISCSATSVTYLDEGGAEGSYVCNDVGQDGYITSNGTRVTTDNVAVTACVFVCTTTGAARSVDIDMTFTQASGANLRAEEKSSYRQKTQVTLRN